MTRSMIHEESTLPVHAYLDGELDPTNALAVEKRMAIDPALAAECERVEVLQRLIREHLPREAPPPGLRMRVENAVGMRRPRPRFADTQFSWRALAASSATLGVRCSWLMVSRYPLMMNHAAGSPPDASTRSSSGRPTAMRSAGTDSR